MKVIEAVGVLNGLKPNAISDAIKIGWLSDVDFKVANEILPFYTYDVEQAVFAGYDPDTDMDDELLISAPYCNAYTFYLMAMIDFYLNNISHYNNELGMFNGRFDEYKAFYHRTHTPINIEITI